MHSPPTLEPRSVMGFHRDLLSDNRRRIRGLACRWGTLLEMHSLGAQELQRKIESSEMAFQETMRQEIRTQQQDLEQAITHWDELLDTQLAYAERRTFESIARQKSDMAKEKSAYKSSRGGELDAFDKALRDLRKRIEHAKAQSAKARDSGLFKLDRESKVLEERMQLAREWVGLKSGDAALIRWISHGVPGRAQQIASLSSIPEVMQEFERSKQKVFERIDALQQHPSLRLVSIPLLIALGVLVGAVATAIAIFAKATTLVCGVAGVSTAVIVPTVISLASTPILTGVLKRLFPPIVDLEKEGQSVLQHGRKLIEQTYLNSIIQLDKDLDAENHVLQVSHRKKLEMIDSSHVNTKKRIFEEALQTRMQLASSRQVEMEGIDHKESRSLSARKIDQADARDRLAKQHDIDLLEMRMAFDAYLKQATARWEKGVHQVIDRIREQRRMISTRFPSWDSAEMNDGSWHRHEHALAWPIGEIGIKDRFSSSLIEASPDPCGITEQQIPVLFDLLHHGNLVIDADVAKSVDAQALVRHLVLRAITALPAGAMHVTVVDPEGLGKEFSWMMHLADIDPHLVNHRVWTQPVHIATQLELHARHVEDIIQQSLRNRFGNLAQYNQQAGPMAIPYRLIVWSGFPLGLDENSWQSICSLLASGARCGVGLILRMDQNCRWPSFADPAKLREYGLVIEMRGGSILATLCNSGFDDHTLQLASGPIDAQVHAIMEQQISAALGIGKRMIPFSSIAPRDPEDSRNSSSDGLEIPIGISESGRMQTLSLGAGTSQHVLIAGKTGSGKSSLLHTMITSGALRYTPDQLRMVLLDFKKGVEFQIYAQEKLPHADILGIESRREFGLSALEYLDRVLTARGEAFREWGVQDLPSLKRKYPDVVLPRILVVIDEFQELFVEDDKLAQQASLLVDRLVRQGRSFGMHLVLASQTLGGSYSLPRTTLAQMAVRIALQCDSSDAMLILSEDNVAAERLRHSGQGIYNDAGGRIEGNHNFQVSYLEKQEQIHWLQSLPASPCVANPTINPIGKQIVFEGYKPSRWDQNSIQALLGEGSDTLRSQSPWVLGESVSIAPPVFRSFPPAAGRNAMIVGSDSYLVASLMASWIRTAMVIDSGNHQKSRFIILDGSSPDDARLIQAIDWARDQDPLVQIHSSRTLDLAFRELQTEWDLRNATPEKAHPPWIIFIANLARFRELRKADDFSFASQENEGGPATLLAKLLADGPPLGFHLCIWADTATTLGRWLPRNVMRDIEIRILMQMSVADSNQLIDSSLANRLDPFVLLVHDDTDGKSIKFRPYELDSVLQDPSKT